MTTTLVGFLTFLLGLLLGNWLAIGRDKRKEFNEAAAPIRGWLLNSKNSPAPSGPWPTEQQRDLFISCLPWWHRTAFKNHWKLYVQAHNAVIEQNPTTGDVSYRSDSEIKEQLAKLLTFTDRK